MTPDSDYFVAIKALDAEGTDLAQNESPAKTASLDAPLGGFINVYYHHSSSLLAKRQVSKHSYLTLPDEADLIQEKKVT